MLKGTVKFFNTERGFGFIVPEDGSVDVFVHITACANQPLIDKQKVIYDIGQDRQGKTCAKNVRAA